MFIFTQKKFILKVYFNLGQPHEGSAYGAQKRWKSALHRLEHTRSRLHELESFKNRAVATSRPNQPNS
jgi:hypothetical protein